MVDILQECVEALVGDFVFVIYAARWAMCNEDVDLRVIGENVVNLLLGIHNSVRICFVADATLEAGKTFALIVPNHLVKIHNTQFFHILTTIMIAVNADFGDIGNISKR